MAQTANDTIFYAAFLIFFGYFVILTINYLALAVVGLLETGKRSRESDDENYPLYYSSTFAIPVSIIIPAHNEEEWIRDCLLSVLSINYPKFEVIVVDDCSRDATPNILNDMLGLFPVDMPYVKHYKDGKVETIFKSKSYPNVTVIRKSASSLKKAGTVNAGLNIAKYEYACVIDADTVIEPDAMIKVMAQVQRDPDRIVGVGSYFGLANGLKIENGRITGTSFSYNPIIAYQNIEYMRSFIGNRVAWSKFNAMPNVAGGFGAWRKDLLYELGGYSVEFTCEDIELTFRAHDYNVKNKKGYKVIMLPYYVGWTEGPSNLKSLISQRERWQRVTNETVWHYRHMLLNPRYGAFAFITMPYFLLYEVLGVFFELASVGFVVYGWLKGILDVRTFLAFLALMLFSQMFISVLCLFGFVRGQRSIRAGHVAYMVFLSLVELFWYRWLVSAAKIIGTLGYLTGRRSYDMYKRAKRQKEEGKR